MKTHLIAKLIFHVYGNICTKNSTFTTLCGNISWRKIYIHTRIHIQYLIVYIFFRSDAREVYLILLTFILRGT